MKENTANKSLWKRITGRSEFSIFVESGAKAIQETMKKYNCTVDIQTIEDFDAQQFADAIDNCILRLHQCTRTRFACVGRGAKQ